MNEIGHCMCTCTLHYAVCNYILLNILHLPVIPCLYGVSALEYALEYTLKESSSVLHWIIKVS